MNWGIWTASLRTIYFLFCFAEFGGNWGSIWKELREDRKWFPLESRWRKRILNCRKELKTAEGWEHCKEMEERDWECRKTFWTIFKSLLDCKSSFKQEKSYVLYHRCRPSDSVISNLNLEIREGVFFKVLSLRIHLQMFGCVYSQVGLRS